MVYKHTEMACDETEGHSLDLSLLNRKRHKENHSELLANSTMISVSEEDQIFKNSTLRCNEYDSNFNDQKHLNDDKISEHRKVVSHFQDTREKDINTITIYAVSFKMRPWYN